MKKTIRRLRTMTRNQKRNLLITIVLIFVLILILSFYWYMIKFNPLLWIANHINSFLVFGTLGIVAILMIVGFWLKTRKKL